MLVIQIKKSPLSVMWYKDKAGERFEVDMFQDNAVRIPNTNKIIYKEDCEIIG